MRIVVDMNLSPDWCPVLAAHGWDTVHWSAVGDPKATDAEIMAWAKTESRVVLTHDLDFGAILAATRAAGPSVVQIRTQDVLPSHLEGLLVRILQQYEQTLEVGALIVVNEAKSRVRILPLSP